jgi:hypothetical protein
MANNLRNIARGSAIAAFALAAGLGVQAADSPEMGTWKLNEAKSTFSPGPAPKDLMTTFSPSGDGVKWRSERAGADGKKAVATFDAKYDGKEYAVVGSPTADKVVLRRIDSRTTERVNMKDGKVTTTERREVAADGRSYVTTVTGTTSTGEPVKNRMVFDRQ